MLVEEDLEGMQFLGNALDVVQSVDAEDDLDISADFGSELVDSLLDRRLLEAIDELVDVDADGKDADAQLPVVVVDGVGRVVKLRILATEEMKCLA